MNKFNTVSQLNVSLDNYLFVKRELDRLIISCKNYGNDIATAVGNKNFENVFFDWEDMVLYHEKVFECFLRDVTRETYRSSERMRVELKKAGFNPDSYMPLVVCAALEDQYIAYQHGEISDYGLALARMTIETEHEKFRQRFIETI